jgi:uncharacterized lipoprotein YbaY
MLSNQASSQVKGEILIGEEIGSFSNATVNAYLEDVSIADAPSKVVAKQVIPNVSHEAGSEKRVPFNLYGEKLDKKANYSVRVHVSLQGDKEIHRGDCITMESHPVLTRGYPNQVVVPVKKVP